jgi:hypothetical protein
MYFERCYNHKNSIQLHSMYFEHCYNHKNSIQLHSIYYIPLNQINLRVMKKNSYRFLVVINLKYFFAVVRQSESEAGRYCRDDECVDLYFHFPMRLYNLNI